MNQTTLFTSGLELANLVVSSDLLHLSWAAIEELNREINPSDPTSPISISHKVYQQPSNITVIAFVSWPPLTTQHLQEEAGDLVSSAALTEDFPLFDFISTKVNSSFSLHRAAVTLFASLKIELSSLKDRYGNIRPLIVTGHSIGGSIASLFTLWLLESISPGETKRPLCITFGSPLLGDNGLQQAISERPTWNSCFFHVASNQDPIPKLFASPPNAVTIDSTPHTSVYKPFGTLLLCSESGFACFEEPESTLNLMVRSEVPNEGLHITYYREILEKLKRGAICRGVSELGEWDVNPFRAGLFIQIEAIKTERTQENDETNSFITKLERRTKDLVGRKRNVFDPNKKLNEMKINMAHVEWFKKVSVSHGGYYDVFKTEDSKRREEIVKRKNILTQYWDKMVREVEKMPQKEGAFFLTKWLYGGTNYRRMVEPLDIAECYRKGNKDYLSRRSEHYKLLETWVGDEKPTQRQSNANERTRAASLTEDSCFWAHVEKAVVSCKLLKDGVNGPENELLRENLVEFENYVMDLVRNYAVSPEIFLKQSSFMKWWEDYKTIKDTSYPSPLVDFMSSHRYEQYA